MSRDVELVDGVIELSVEAVVEPDCPEAEAVSVLCVLLEPYSADPLPEPEPVTLVLELAGLVEVESDDIAPLLLSPELVLVEPLP